MRVLIAGLLGAVAMFIWTSIAHVATPLGQIGFHQVPGEAAVLSAMRGAIGERGGLYFFPWTDMNAPDAMEKAAEAMKTNPSGLLLYTPAGGASTNMTPQLVAEFLKQLAQALIAAWIVAQLAGFARRALAVALIGVSASFATNVSYWNWYGFPLDYTMAQIFIEIVSGVLAGVVIAYWLGRAASVGPTSEDSE
jgi:hypothetical protein